MNPLTRSVTSTQPVTGVIEDLVRFVQSLEKRGVIKYVGTVDNSQLVSLADAFWDTNHGEDD